MPLTFQRVRSHWTSGTEKCAVGHWFAADAVVALALVHHLAIGRNIPFTSLLDWLLGLAPRGVVEFVPKSDPMVQRQFREDVFAEYGKEQFEAALRSRAEIVRVLELAPEGRTLYEYRRRP
ncbi:hypothetical protein UB31_39545 [Bradyrhizobium sp. LTSP849]|uniref:hypothetical protein n=1 Tax=Bradyrhizobium sp. LTSP849 TaxID=1615890 RepID=UPI0005D1B0B6|nr:hypothetical protein [Bradyrhizobium sp. LTSP849]KJC34276.1 hypothetical protein UB31_39545 [Bradyrhizobium sp. LTSP849]